MRRRRRLTTGLGSGIAVLLAVAGVAAVAGSGNGTPTQLAAGGPTTTINQSLQATGGSIFAVDAPTTTSGAPELATATTAVPRVTTTAPVAPETTDPEPTTAPTVAPATTVAGPAQPRCGPAQLEATLTFAQPTYRAGQQAVGQGVLRNRSGAPCYYYSYTQSQEFKNEAGVPVAPGSALIADAFADTAFAPAQTLSAAPTWDLTLCATNPACPPAPPGTYIVTVSWSFDGPPVTASASFQIVP